MIFCFRLIWYRSTRAPLMESVSLRPSRSTLRPSAWLSRSSMSLAMISMTFFLSASCAVIETLRRTASIAHSAFLPRCRAIVSPNEAVKFSIFSPMTPLTSCPPLATGCAAPMLVAGAIAAMCPAMVMKTPADAAPAPLGATYTITGTGEPNISFTMVRVEFSSPPGVSS